MRINAIKPSIVRQSSSIKKTNQGNAVNNYKTDKSSPTQSFKGIYKLYDHGNTLVCVPGYNESSYGPCRNMDGQYKDCMMTKGEIYTVYAYGDPRRLRPTSQNLYIDEEGVPHEVDSVYMMQKKEIEQIRKEVAVKQEAQLVEVGKIDEAIEFRKTKNRRGVSPVVNYLADKGLLREAKSLDDGSLKSHLADMGLNEDGEYHYNIPNVDDTDTDYIEEIYDDVEQESNRLMFQVDDAVNTKMYKPDKQRIVEGVLTLGLSEVFRSVKKSSLRKKYINIMQERLDAKKDSDAVEIEAMKQKSEKTKTTREVLANLLALEEKKEAIRDRLETRVVTPIRMSTRGEHVKVPNCVMFEGENPYITQEFAKWTAETSGADYVITPSQTDTGEMQKDLTKELKSAAKNWSKNKKRTVIFAEGMEKLIDPKQNSEENIASMKDFMQKTDRKYHATIVFHTFDKSKLDSGATGSNRALSIKSDISFDDADILKPFRTMKAGQ